MRHSDIYEPVIGLEVHCQLLTESKSFSPESAVFGAAPNTHIDPISLGHPGTLPVLNQKVVEYSVCLGLVTHCEITPRSVFARKHYFYPDLPKGYQISQFETPICYGGYIEIDVEEDKDDSASYTKTRRIGLTRIHMEEDAGKSVHDQDPYYTLLDYNRCGVPLVEIVSEPDIRSPREAYLYLQKIRQIVRYLGICDGNMEEGSLRCDANVSVRPRGQETLGTKTEVKNLNSFRNVERALEYEINRQISLLEKGGTIRQQTLLWDTDRQETRTMRSKEEAHDYRYYPDPDLAEVVVSEETLDSIKRTLPEMPATRSHRFQNELGLPAYDASLLSEERGIADYFEETLDCLKKAGGEIELMEMAKAVSNFVMTDVMRVLNEMSISVDMFPIDPPRLAGLIALRLGNKISSTGAQDIFNAMLDDNRTAIEIAEANNLLQVSDKQMLLPIIEKVLADNPKQVAEYHKGKKGLIGYFIGQVMRGFPGSPDPKLVRKILSEKLDSL